MEKSKKTSSRKFIIITVAILVATVIIMCLTKFTVSKLSAGYYDYSSNSMQEEQPGERYYGTLKVGRYIHESGDKTRYIEVFEDQTVQVFNYYDYEFEKYKDYYDTLTEEELSKRREYWEWFSQRHFYVVENYEYSGGRKESNIAFADAPNDYHTHVDEAYCDNLADLPNYDLPNKKVVLSRTNIIIQNDLVLFINAYNIYIYSGS